MSGRVLRAARAAAMTEERTVYQHGWYESITSRPELAAVVVVLLWAVWVTTRLVFRHAED